MMWWSLWKAAVQKACQIANGLQPETAKEGILTVEKRSHNSSWWFRLSSKCACFMTCTWLAFPEDCFFYRRRKQ
jgi:hypothetical protein